MKLFVCLLVDLLFVICVENFIPHPSIRLGGQAGESITHSELTQIGFVRSFARYLFENKTIRSRRLTKKHFTVDQLFHFIYPKLSKEKLEIQSYPLKSILDTIVAENAFVDFSASSKKLPAAHFDSEAFRNGSRRMIKLRRSILQIVVNRTGSLTEARRLLGQVLHTLQDFYSHSNWIELGKENINEHLGLDENIGPVAQANQSTCSNDGCVRKQIKCNLWQKLTLKNCPLEFYECKNNIRAEIIEQGLLTSGYSINQRNEDGQAIFKPTDVEKCSHGSVMDTSSHLPAIGGINKDATKPIYSPHFDLHFQAASMAVLATEKYFNDLRKDLTDEHFDRLFAIHPTIDELRNASKSIGRMRKFSFFTPSISSGIELSSHLFDDIRKSLKKRMNKIKWALSPNSNDILLEDISFR